jgi:hypothetical protein
MVTKVARAKSTAKQRIRSSGAAQAHDAKLLAQAAAEDTRRPSQVSIDGAVQKLRQGCDQLGQAIAEARSAEDFDTVDNLTPVLASIWSARMELGDGPAVTP